MDIELIMDVLNKHNITNIALAEDIQTLAKECYSDGRYDEAFWWQEQDGDDAWIGQFDFDTEEEIIPNEYEIWAAMAENPGKIEVSPEAYEKFVDMLEDSSPPSQELIDAYERFKQANIKFNLDKPLDEQDDEE